MKLARPAKPKSVRAFEGLQQRDYLVGMQIQGKVVIVTGGSNGISNLPPKMEL
jgi:hypothetical protein